MTNSTISAINQLLFIEDTPQQADLIFALGSREMEVIKKAVELYQQKPAPFLLISGGTHDINIHTTKEAEIFKDFAMQQGIPEERIITEAAATNTKENFVFTKALVEATIGFQNVHKVILVGKNFHARRSIMTAKQWWPDHIKYLFVPIVDQRNIQPNNWWLNEIARLRVLDEVRRIGEYASKEDINLSD